MATGFCSYLTITQSCTSGSGNAITYQQLVAMQNQLAMHQYPQMPYYGTGTSVFYPVSTWSYDYPSYYKPCASVPTAKQKMAAVFKARMASPVVLSHRRPVMATKDVRELRARGSLLALIGERNYQGFLRNGFITLNGRDGRSYQIYPGNNHTRVFEKGKLVEELCVVLSGAYCPTDSLLMRYVMLLNDEGHFRKLSNVHKGRSLPNFQIKPVEHTPLVDVFAKLKIAA